MSDDQGPAPSVAGETALPDSVRQLQERRRYAVRDLEELADQVAAGELDEATADRLRAGYQAELDAVEARLASTGEPVPRTREAAPASPPAGRSPTRAAVGALLLIGAFTVVIVMAAQVFRSGGDATPQSEPSTSAIDSATLQEMEDVVAAHPDNIAMRIALADVYFERGEYSSAIDHYLAVLSGEMTVEEESHTLGRIGWMAYATGQIDAAVDYLNASLTADPGYNEGKLFLGLVTLYGLEDAEGAIPLLEEVLALPDLREEIRAQVQLAVTDARAVLEGP